MAEPWEAAPVVEDAEPWAAAPIVGGDGPRGVDAIPRGNDVAPPAQSVARVSRVTSVPGGAAPAPATPPTLMDRVGAGIQAGLNLAAGFVGGAVGMPYGAVEAVGINAENAVRGRPERVDLEGQMVKRTQQFTPELPQALQSDLGREYTQDLGEDIAYQAQALPGVGQPITIAARGAAGIAEGARATRRGIADTVRADADRGVQAITPAMTPEKLAMAGKAVDAGIPLRPDMLGENKLAKIAGEGAEHIPFTGGPGQRNKRQIAFNQGLLKEIDPEATAERITPDVFDAAMTKAGETIGEISARTPVPFENVPDLMSVARRETPDVQGVIRSYAEDIQLLADQNGGVIDGTAFRKINSEIGAQMRRTPNGDLKNALGNLQKRLHDALVESAAPEDIPTLIDARRRYAIGSALVPLVAKSVDGNISPAALMGRVTADNAGKTRMARGRGGSLGEYAQIGQMFLKEQPTSMTAERNLAYRLATDAAAAAKATAAYLPALAYNLLGPRVAKRMVDSARRRGADGALPDVPPEPTLGAGFEDVPQPRPGARPNPNDGPLGDITPDLETSPGAAATDPAVWRSNREPGPVETRPREPGLNRAIDEPQAESPPGMRTLRPDEYPAPRQDGIPFDAEPALRGAQPPDWETAPGARAPADPLELVPTDGLHRAAGDPNDTSPMRRQRSTDMPVVPGLPGVDDVAVAGRDPVPFVDIKPGAMDRLAQRPAGEGGPPPPPPAPPAPPAPPKKPSGPAPLQWADLNSPEMKKWRQDHGLGADDAARAVEVGKALQIDPEAVKAAAIQHENSPRKFDAEVAKIIEKDTSNAPETKPTVESSPEPAPTPKRRSADDAATTQGAAKPARPNSAPAPRPSEGVKPQPAPAAPKPETLDLKGFEQTPRGNGAFDLTAGNMRVSVEPTGRGKFQAAFGSAKSSPHLQGEQGAIDWAAQYRDDAVKAAKPAAQKAPPPKTPEPPAAVHKDPGKAPEPVTPAVVAKAVKTGAADTGRKPSELKADLLRQVDEAIAKAPEKDPTIGTTAPHTERGKTVFTGSRGTAGSDDYVFVNVRSGSDGKWLVHDGSQKGLAVKPIETLTGIDTPAKARKAVESLLERATRGDDGHIVLGAADLITFHVPGDGTFKVRNTGPRLREFRKQAEASPGFKDPSSRTTTGLNVPPAFAGRSTIDAVRDMLLEGDLSTALETMRATHKVFGYDQAGGVYTHISDAPLDGGVQAFVGRRWDPKKGDQGWAVVHRDSGFTLGTAATKSGALELANKGLKDPDALARVKRMEARGETATGVKFKSQKDLQTEFEKKVEESTPPGDRNEIIPDNAQGRSNGADAVREKGSGQDGPVRKGDAADEGQGQEKSNAPEVDEPPDPPPPGTYSTRTGPVTTRKQSLGHVGPVKTMQDAANALAYLHKSAVERFDALVTDAAGNPLAIVGGFKGALTQTSVYPSTIAGEVAQIPRAANLWMVHNHPSGLSRLSRADESLARNIAGVFEGTKVKVRSIIAVADETWNGGDIGSNFDDSASGVVKPTAEGKGPTVPARERQILETGKLGSAIESPAQAKDAIRKAIADHNGESVILLLDAQHNPVAIVPWSAADAKPLKDNGKLDALHRAVAHSNAGAALIGKGAGMTDAQALNLGKALQNIDVRSLDIIDAGGKSAAEAGMPTAGSTLYSEGKAAKPIGTTQALDTALRTRFGDKLIQGLVDQGALKLALAADEGMTGARGRVKAVMRETSDRQPAATLFADRLSVDQAPRVLMHELGEHFGIVRLLGDDRYKVLLDELQAARKQPEVAEAWQHVKDNYTSTDSASRLQENEPRFLREVAARLVEDHPDLPWVRRLINEIRAFFYENFGTTMGNRVDADLIRGLAAAALRKASKGELDRMRTPVRMLDGAPVKRRSPETQFDSRAQ